MHNEPALPATATTARQRPEGMKYPQLSIDMAIFEAAARQPAALAVRQGDQTLSYGQLTAGARRVADQLIERGIKENDIVAVCLPRSPALACALLGVLVGRAAYCIIDPQWPAARKAEIVADIGATIVLVDEYSGPVDGLPDTMRLDAAPAAAPRPPGSPDPVRLDAGFCVYYTSGSTGRPKAALTTHRAVFRTLLAPRHPRVRPGLTMLCAAALPWDAFTLELWFPLLHGGTVELLDGDHLGPAELRRAIRAGVTTAWLTSSVFNLLVDEEIDAFSGIAEVLTGGERLSPPHVRRFLRRHPEVSLANGYGPVETSVFVTTHTIVDADCDNPLGIPVGRPLPATEILLLRAVDGGGYRQAGTNEPGEIAVAGDGLGLGYVGAAAEDNERRFPTVRVGDGPPRRVYLTGDLGIWSPDGNLMFVGRADRQVKIRGNRVDPAEVEAAVLAHSSIARCVVTAVARGTTKVLVAYVVARRAGEDPHHDALVEHLAGTLPQHLVPSRIVGLPALPIGPTGKLDHAALPHPFAERSPDRQRAGGAATTDAWTLARLAGKLLGVPDLTPEHDLVADGLDSLTAIRLAHQASEHHGLDIGVKDVLRLRTPSAIVAAPRTTTSGHDLPTPAGSLGQSRTAFWLDDQIRPERRAANLVAFAYRLTGLREAVGLSRALRTLVGRHDALHTAIQENPDGEPVPVPLPVTAALSLRVKPPSDQPASTDVQGVTVRLAAEIDLHDGPLLAAEIHLDRHGATLMLVAHHAVVDGHSEVLIADEISRLMNGEHLTDVAAYHSLTGLPATTGADQEISAWVERLSRTHDVRWPTPGPRSGRYQAIRFALDPAGAAALTRVAHRHQVTPFVVALDTFATAVRDASGARSFCVGVPDSGRDLPSSFATIGCFVHTLAVPFDDESRRAEIQGTAQAWDTALRHRDVALHDLTGRCRTGPRRGSRLFDVQFVWQNYGSPRWHIRGVDVQPIDVEPLQSQCDVTLELFPGRDVLRGRLAFDETVVPRTSAQELVEAFMTGIRRMTTPTTEGAR
ncbi:AMP-binding protein [Actinoplanes sp. NPDC048791]|uniref:AMP-binding protein n=1 Tax=Actinoplanes sp. NPDC048791 TaxID=3154623 RepID=UPI0033C25DDC